MQYVQRSVRTTCGRRDRFAMMWRKSRRVQRENGEKGAEVDGCSRCRPRWRNGLKLKSWEKPSFQGESTEVV